MRFPPRALAEDPQHQPARARQPGDRAPLDVVGIYPNDAALLRLATSLLVEQNDEWLIQKRYLSLHSLALLTDRPFGPADAGPPAQHEGALAGVGKNTT